jgi:hypothetical protein
MSKYAPQPTGVPGDAVRAGFGTDPEETLPDDDDRFGGATLLIPGGDAMAAGDERPVERLIRTRAEYETPAAPGETGDTDEDPGVVSPGS